MTVVPPKMIHPARSGLPILTTLLTLGVLIIVLGVGWRDVRGTLMRHLPDFPFKTKLPPYSPHDELGGAGNVTVTSGTIILGIGGGRV